MTDAFGNIPIDVDPLLDPISPEHPAGASLRYEDTYDQVKDARHADNPSLPQGIYERELDVSDWDAVERLCTEALENRTKDLQLAAWLTEAWIENHGFAGAAASLDLLAGLVEGFWNALYPSIKDGDLDYRIGPLQWINDTLSVTLCTVPVTDPDVSGESDVFALRDWERAEPGDATGENAPSRADVLTSATLTPTTYYRSLVDRMEALLDASRSLERLLSERCGPETVGLEDWKTALKDIQSFGRRILAEREPAEESSSEHDEGDDTADWMQAGGDGQPAGAAVDAASVTVRSRAGAYRLLWEAAEFLLRTEPHSPTPYLVKRAVSWGNMPLNELLRELMQGGSDLNAIYELLGMDSPPAEEEASEEAG